MKVSGISHIYTTPQNPFPAKLKKILLKVNEFQLEQPSAVKKLPQLKIDANKTHPLDFFMMLKGNTEKMVKDLYTHIHSHLGKIKIDKLRLEQICQELLDPTAHLKDVEIEAIRKGLLSCTKWMTSKDKVERITHLYKVYLMLEAIEQQTWALNENLDLPSLTALVNTIAFSAQDSDISKFNGIVEETLREFLHYQKYHRAMQAQMDMQTRIGELSYLLKTYNLSLKDDKRLNKEKFRQIERLFSLAKTTTKESKEGIDFFVYDQGMHAFFDFLDAVIEMKVPLVSEIVDDDYSKKQREQYMKLTLEPRTIALVRGGH